MKQVALKKTEFECQGMTILAAIFGIYQESGSRQNEIFLAIALY